MSDVGNQIRMDALLEVLQGKDLSNLTIQIMDKVKIKVAYIECENALGCKHKEFSRYADFTMWACEESNRLKDGLKIIGMTVKIGE
jgi:hypothetical protein